MGWGANLTAVGMASSLGEGAAAGCAAIRARLNAFTEYADYLPRAPEPPPDDLEPLVGALAGPGPRGAEAVIALFVSALQDLLRRARLARRDLAEIPIVASLPSPARSARDAELSTTFLRAVAARAGVTLDPASAVLSEGHAGAFLAVQRAHLLLQPRTREAVIVAAVESYFAPEALDALDAAGRLKSRRNLDGFIPGECAVAILLERPEASSRREVAPIASLGLPGFGFEERAVGSGEAATGAGLCEAVRAALGPEATPVEWALGDLNGEAYRAAEWARARVRLSSTLGRARHLWHPADCLGDVGAASGGALLAVAAAAFARGYAPADRALLFTGSDEGTRAAITLDRAPGG